MKKILLISIVLFSNIAFAGGWTTYDSNNGNVEFVEVVRAQGFMVQGTFGNPAGCTVSNQLWIPIEHPQYDHLYSMALAAFMSGKKIQAYAHNCTEIGWHGGSYNTLSGAGSLYLKN